MTYQRKKTRQIKVGNVLVGGGAPITVQTMTKTDTRDAAATIYQIKELERIGCEIIRVAVPDQEAAESLRKIKKEISIPLVADIHFDYRLAMMAIESGVDGLRINPGNIGGPKRVHELVRAAAEQNLPIRIGVNMGSLHPDIADKYGRTAKGLVESALTHVSLLERENYYNIVISVKAISVPVTIEAYRMLSEKVDYPLHLGVTEAGGAWVGTIKSAIGIGSLLAEGIGDTIRVSLTEYPHEEVRVGKQILKSLGLRSGGMELISCPTCGRCQIDLFKVLNEVEKQLPVTDEDLKVAIMGCMVNGPGEAKDADIGIAGGKGCGILFKHGKLVRKIPEDELLETLISEIKQILEERKQAR
ncbi:MAG: flavodoxin-dependent (E)-4-hydroxy-3-methylbut-2-enyl-diphosphate synthase [Syntrophaceticus sp.]